MHQTKTFPRTNQMFEEFIAIAANIAYLPLSKQMLEIT
jgi:hypothetical protein